MGSILPPSTAQLYFLNTREILYRRHSFRFTNRRDGDPKEGAHRRRMSAMPTLTLYSTEKVVSTNGTSLRRRRATARVPPSSSSN
jgi:hypothetical protein